MQWLWLLLALFNWRVKNREFGYFEKATVFLDKVNRHWMVSTRHISVFDLKWQNYLRLKCFFESVANRWSHVPTDLAFIGINPIIFHLESGVRPRSINHAAKQCANVIGAINSFWINCIHCHHWIQFHEYIPFFFLAVVWEGGCLMGRFLTLSMNIHSNWHHLFLVSR